MFNFNKEDWELLEPLSTEYCKLCGKQLTIREVRVSGICSPCYFIEEFKDEK